MSDILDKVLSDRDPLQKLLSYIPGFKGYYERSNRRDADKLLRETLATRIEQVWQRISSVQRDLLNSGGLMYIDDLESAAIKLRTFADRVRNATYGYAGIFDAVNVNTAELDKLHAYDLALFEYVERLHKAVDHVEQSLGSEGLPAAIRNLTSIAQESIDTFNLRGEVVLGKTTTE
jgi:hypothetical protein